MLRLKKINLVKKIISRFLSWNIKGKMTSIDFNIGKDKYTSVFQQD